MRCGLLWVVLHHLRVATAANRTTVVFVRIQKTGSKTLLSILEQCLFTACPKRPISAVDSKACHTAEKREAFRTIRGKDEFACHISSHCGIDAYDFVFNESLLVAAPSASSSSRRRGSRVSTAQKRLNASSSTSSSSSSSKREPTTTATTAAAASKQRLSARTAAFLAERLPTSSAAALPVRAKEKPSAVRLGPRRPFVVTILRDPVARYLSEFRHVCQSGQGQWDYSTLPWRLEEAARLNYTVPAPRAKNVSSTAERVRAAEFERRRKRHATLAKQREEQGLPPPPPLPQKTQLFSKTTEKKKIPPFHVDCSSTEAVLSFLNHPNHTNGASNRQTRMLAGAVMHGSRTDPRPEDVLFRLAQTILREKVDVAIVFERFHLSLVVLAKRLGLPPVEEFSILKEKTEDQPKPRVNRTVLDAVAKRNKYDVLLHQEATRLLEDSPEAEEAFERASQTLLPTTTTPKDDERNKTTLPGVSSFYECKAPPSNGSSLQLSTLEKQLHYYEAKRCRLATFLRDLQLEDQRAASPTHTSCRSRTDGAKRRDNAKRLAATRVAANRTKAKATNLGWWAARQRLRNRTRTQRIRPTSAKSPSSRQRAAKPHRPTQRQALSTTAADDLYDDETGNNTK